MRLSTERPSHRRAGQPRGATLVELVVTMLLLSIIMGSVLRVVNRQQRFAFGAAQIGDLRSQLRQAALVLPSDLFSVSSTGSDLVLMTDTAAEVRTTYGTTVVCAIVSNTVTVPPTGRLDRGVVLSSWLSTPATTDSVMLFDEGSNVTASTDDNWRFLPLTGFATLASSASGLCPLAATAASPGFVTSNDLTARPTASGYRLTLGGSSVPGTVRVGAPIRFVRHVRYSLYRARDAKWYLGYCGAPPCSSTSPPQPIAGPLLPYVSAGSSSNGLTFRYRDTTGTITSTAASVARIEIVARAQTAGAASLSGSSARAKVTDSVVVTMAVRNRN